VAVGLVSAEVADRRLARIAERVGYSGELCQRRVAPLRGTPVVASGHQAAFCRWLGLDVVATFNGADSATVSEIDQAVRAGEQAGATLVVANRPEGRRVADALADRLGAAVVVLDNFPALDAGPPSFDDLLQANAAALAQAAAR
jgi:hypothetical protein